MFFMPYRQNTRLWIAHVLCPNRGDPQTLLATIPPRRQPDRLDTAGRESARAARQVRANVFLDRFVTTLSTAFAGSGDAARGDRPVRRATRHSVAQRTREIGLRMALGATPARVRTMVLRQVASWSSSAARSGSACARRPWAGMRQSMLYQMKGSDASVLASAAAALALVALASALVPAYRASRIDPMRALRQS